MRGHSFRWLLAGLLLIFLALIPACSSMAPTQGEPIASPTEAPAAEAPAMEAQEPGTAVPVPTPEAGPVETRLVELEWPAELRMGESDVIRLALVPTRDGYTARAEFPEHDLQTREVPIPRPNGYLLYAAARLDGVGFEIVPGGDQERLVPEGEEVAWRWSLSPRAPGQQRLSIQVRLRWEPAQGDSGPVHESLAFGRGIDVQVRSFLGLSRAQAASSGLVGLFLGCGFLLVALVGRKKSAAWKPGEPVGIQRVSPPLPGPQIDAKTGMTLSGEEKDLLGSLFDRYARVALESEFLSGYSGARTFLVRPVRLDGCSDALTIVKIGPVESIRQEHQNYEMFVKDRLPPVTARIQRAPVMLASSHRPSPAQRAAVQYTFIAEPGRDPVSLGHALRENPDPALLQKLFETFAPNWWMQRRSDTFRVAREYDRLLPPHYMLRPILEKPIQGGPPVVSEDDSPGTVRLEPGNLVRLRGFQRIEPRADGVSFTLFGSASSGGPALRLRWLDAAPPGEGAVAEVSATRMGLLRGWTGQFDRFGLPDPCDILAPLLEETLNGTRSVIHGDLNLENVLVGPGSLVWLIDFALTREGHPLFDFAHLESELIAHILAGRAGSPRAYLDLWRSEKDPLLNGLHGIAGRCLLDPARPREYHLALFLACMGALKYQNLTPLSQCCLFLTAADLAEKSILSG